MSHQNQERIEDLASSAKLIFKILQFRGSQTQKQLITESLLCSRTVRYALEDLKEANIVTEEVYLPDARQSLYELTAGSTRDHGAVAEDRWTTNADESPSDGASTGEGACCTD